MVSDSSPIISTTAASRALLTLNLQPGCNRRQGERLCRDARRRYDHHRAMDSTWRSKSLLVLQGRASILQEGGKAGWEEGSRTEYGPALQLEAGDHQPLELATSCL